jgi:hypothetical protein
VRLLPPAGYAVVGAVLGPPLPLDLLRSLLVVSPTTYHGITQQDSTAVQVIGLLPPVSSFLIVPVTVLYIYFLWIRISSLPVIELRPY